MATRYPRPGSDLADVDVEVRPFGCKPERAARLLEDVAVPLVGELRAALQAHPDRRTYDRVDFTGPVEVRAAGNHSLKQPVHKPGHSPARRVVHGNHDPRPPPANTRQRQHGKRPRSHPVRMHDLAAPREPASLTRGTMRSSAAR